MQQRIPNIALGLKCPSCGCPFVELTREVFHRYLRQQVTTCAQCDASYDLFKVVACCIDENFFYNDVYTFVGAEKTIFNITLDVEPSTTLKFEECGIPKGSRILHINYTPQGQGLFPLEFHSNSPYRGAPRDQVVLYPARFGDDNISPTNVSVMVTWIRDESLENVSLKSLVDALEEYSREELMTSIVPANTAIEFDVMRCTENALLDVSSKNSVKEFFKSGVGYVPTLKVVMPLVAKMYDFPLMTKEMIDSLVQLASLRNQIAHTGTTKGALSKTQVAGCLTTVILGKMYINELSNA